LVSIVLVIRGGEDRERLCRRVVEDVSSRQPRLEEEVDLVVAM
jgi:hypothetical protein